MTHCFVIVRHGNTFAPGEPPRRIGARTDLPLVETGRDQANALGRLFADRGWRFNRILCSPLRRTRETAAIIRARLGIVAAERTSALLAEIDHGVDEDRTEDVVIARIGAAALLAWDQHGIAPPGWQVDRAARLAGWRALFAETQAEPGTTLLVTSNGAARFAMLADPALTARGQTLSALRLRTGAFGVIQSGPAGLDLVTWDERP